MARGGRSSKLAQDTFEASLRQLNSFVEKKGVRAARAFLREMRRDIYSELLAAGGAPTKNATAAQLSAMLGQLDAMLSKRGKAFERMLNDTAREAAKMGARHAVKEFKALEKHFSGTVPMLGLDRAEVFEGLIDGTESSLLRRHKRSMQIWGATLVGQIESHLSLGVATGRSIYTHDGSWRR